MFQSIKHKLIFLFLIAVLTPLLVMRLIAYPTATKAIQDTEISNLQSIGSRKAAQVRNWLDRLQSGAGRVARNPVVRDAANATHPDRESITKFISQIPCEAEFNGYIICDVSGVIRLATDARLIGADMKESKAFHGAMGGKAFISDITDAPFVPERAGNWENGLPSMHVAAPIKNEADSVVGVVMLQVDLAVLNKEIHEGRYGDSGEAYVMNQHGMMITESILAERLRQAGRIKGNTTLELAVREPQTSQLTKSAASCLKGTDGFDVDGYINYAGEKVVGVWYRIPELRWGVITERSFAEVSLALSAVKIPILEILYYLTVTGVVLAVAGIAFALIIGQKIANPLMALIAATRKMSAGDLSQRVAIKTRDEVRELGDAFNVMAASVQEKTTNLQEAQNFLKSILVSSTEHSIIASDLDGGILAFNEGSRRMFGYEPEELIQKSTIRILHSKADVAPDKVKEMFDTTLSVGRYKSEMQLIRKNGEVFTGFSTVTTRQSADGKPIGFVMITRDITEQKSLEQEIHNYTVHLEQIVEERTQKLRISEEKYRRLFESSKDVVFFCDRECLFADINQAGVDLFGYESKNELLKLNLVTHLFFNPGTGKTVKEMVNKNGFIKDYEVELRKKDGAKVPCLMTSNLRRDVRNNVIGYEGIIIDLTERKKIEQEKDILNNINKILASRLDIREVYKTLGSELNKVIDFDRMSITLLDEKREEFSIFAVSKEYDGSTLEEGLHYPKYGTLAGKVVEDGMVYMVGDTSRGAFSTDTILLKEGIKSRLSVPLICKGEIIGSLNFGSKNVQNYSDNHVDIVSKITPQLAIAIDNTRLFDKIKESEEKYRNLVEDIEDVIFRLDKLGRYLFLNSALKNVTGYTPGEFYDKPFLAMEMIHGDDVELVRETTKNVLEGKLKASKDLEYRIFCKNRKELWVSQNTYPIKNKKGDIVGIEGIIRDITTSKKVEEQIRRSERLASIGELAASIAHEIRNPLGAISNSVSVLKRDLALKGDDQRLFEMVVEETDHLNEIITNFLTFAHPADYSFVRGNIREIVDETVFLLEQDARFQKNVRIIKVYDDGVPESYLDRIWIRKIFWNLLLNSIDAMPQGGKIFIHIKKPKISNPNEIEIVISDTGEGIPPDIMKKIFEPFFTTKKSKGTGLGLSIVHRIVDNHGGKIDVKSKPGKGTVFTIRLPVKNKLVTALSSQAF